MFSFQVFTPYDMYLLFYHQQNKQVYNILFYNSFGNFLDREKIFIFDNFLNRVFI